MISARLLLILHKYAGIYMGASAQGGRTLASEIWDRARLVRAGMGRAGLGSWAEPGASLRAYGANNFCPQLSARRAQTENSAHEKSRQNSARQIANASTFFSNFFYIEILALILMNLGDFILLYAKYRETRENAKIFLFNNSCK